MEMKKRLITGFAAILLGFCLTACGNGNDGNTSLADSGVRNTEPAAPADTDTAQEDNSTPEDTQEVNAPDETDSNQKSNEKILVVYFSVPETDSAENMNAEEEYSTVVIDGEVLGNTQYVAYVIQENTGADIFRIEPVTPYPMNHAELEEVATEEKRNDAMPEIAASVENMEQYKTVFLGYPNWYADMPRIIYSFLDQYDLSGKTIVPFVTSGGSGFSNTISTIAELEPDAEVVTDGLSISRNVVQDAEADIIQWVNELGY